MTRARLALLLAAASCGESTMSPPAADGGRAATDAAAPTADAAAAPACSFAMCEPVGPAVLVSGEYGGSDPQVAWAGDRFLVVHSFNASVDLVALEAGAEPSWRLTLGGLQAAELAWHPERAAGLVVMDSGVQWLGAGGAPAGDYLPIAVDRQVYPTVAPTPSGFAVLAGHSWSPSGDAPALAFAHADLEPGDLELHGLPAGGPRCQPKFALDDAGLAALAAVSTCDGAVIDLWRIDGAADPALVGVVPDANLGWAEAVEVGRAHTWLLRQRYDGERTEIWLQELAHEGAAAAYLIDAGPLGATADLARLGDQLVLASVGFPGPGPVTVSELDGATGERVGAPLELSRAGRAAYSARLARWPRGLVVVWAQGPVGPLPSEIALQALDCCEP